MLYILIHKKNVMYNHVVLIQENIYFFTVLCKISWKTFQVGGCFTFGKTF